MKQMTLDEMISPQTNRSLGAKNSKRSSEESDQIIRIRLPNPTFPEESRVQALLFAIHFSRFLQGVGYTQIKLNTVNLAIEFKSDRSGEGFLDGLFDKYVNSVEDGIFARFEKSASLSMAGYDHASPKTFKSELKEVTGYDLKGKQSDKLPYRERVFVDALKGMRDAVGKTESRPFKTESRPFVDAEKPYSKSKICPFCGLPGGNRGKPIRITTLSSAEKLWWMKGKKALVACSRCVCMGNIARITVPWMTQIQTSAKQGSEYIVWLVNHFESTKPMLSGGDLANAFKEYREYEYILLTPRRIGSGIKTSRDQLFNVLVKSPVLSRFLTETTAENDLIGNRILQLKCSALIQKVGRQAEVEGEYDWKIVHETARFALACSRVFRSYAVANASVTGYRKHLSDSLLVLRDTRSAHDAARYLIEKITLDSGSGWHLSLEQVGELRSISSRKDTKEVLGMIKIDLELMKNPTKKGADVKMLDHNNGFLRYTAGVLAYRAKDDERKDDQVIGDAYSRLYKVREDNKAEIITDFIEFLTDKGGMKSDILHPEAISMCSQVLYNFTPDEIRIYAKLLRVYATIYCKPWTIHGDTLAKEVLKELELR